MEDGGAEEGLVLVGIQAEMALLPTTE